MDDITAVLSSKFFFHVNAFERMNTPIPEHPLGYEETFVIRTYEIDSRRQATPATLVRLMQEAAMQNVIRLKLSVWDLEPHHISWVLMRMNLHVNRLPHLGESIRILTYPAGFEKFFTHRDAKIFDAHNNLLVSSASTWLLMDTQTRHMARIPDFILAYNHQMPAAADCLPHTTNKLPKWELANDYKNYEVNWHDLDFNAHLNNTLYLQWMLETLPDDLLQTGSLKELHILFKTEGRWKDTLQAELQVMDNQHFLHRLIRTSDSKELAMMHTVFHL